MMQTAEEYQMVHKHNDRLKEIVIEALDKCVLTSEEIWVHLRKMMEREGMPPPPTEQRPATEMDQVYQLHTELKQQTTNRLAGPMEYNCYVGSINSLDIARNLTPRNALPSFMANHMEEVIASCFIVLFAMVVIVDWELLNE